MSRPLRSMARLDFGQIVRNAAAAAGVAVTIVMVIALSVWAVAPVSWQSLIAKQQQTDATVGTVALIWANNVLICCLPIFAGVSAHRLVERGRRGWARIVIAIAAFGVARSLFVIGLVGGLDPGWLAGAVAWWIPETTALAVCWAAAWHAFRNADSATASERLAHAFGFACVLLGVAAVVEVALT